MLEVASKLRLEVVTTSEGLERMRPEWTALWSRCPTATPFASPAWLIPWWRHLGEGDLRALALRFAGRLVGFAPLYVYTQENGSRDVFPVGIATTDYLDVLFEPGVEEAGMEAVFGYLDERRGEWDVCEFPDLPESSALLNAPAPRGWSEETGYSEPCPVLTLPPTEDRLGEAVPPRLLHNLRYYMRRAEKAGAVTFERASRGNLYEIYDALLRLHRARWETRGEAGVLADDRVQRAHREALPELLSLGVLRLYAMRIDGRIVACYYGFMGGPRRRAYYYLSGFEPGLAPLSPGTLILGHAVREALREGALEFDFLRGQESYKYLWGAQDRWNRRRRLWRG